MGLKTENYVSESTGLTLGKAYAVLRNLIIESDNRARAIFAVQATRENAEKYKPLDKVEVYFTWDRKTDPAKAAYEAAKVQARDVERYDEELKKSFVEKEYGTLYGWEDDIV